MPPPDATLMRPAALCAWWRTWRQRRRTDAGWSPLDEPEET